MRTPRSPEGGGKSAAWFAVACWLPLQPVVTEPYHWRRVAVLLLLAAIAVAAMRFRVAPLAGAAALVLIPLAGGVVNYPHLDTPELRQLSEWAAHSTARDAVFLFPDAGRSLEPGVFRSQALRTVYVDWKGGGQVNFVRGFGETWWRRWSQPWLTASAPPMCPSTARPASITSCCRPNSACRKTRYSPTPGIWSTRSRVSTRR